MGDLRSSHAVRMAIRVNLGPDPRVLRTIAMEGVSAAIWHRTLTDGFRDWIDVLSPEHLPRLSATVATDMMERAVLVACDRASTPASHWRDGLAEDAGALAHLFAEAVRAPFLRVRIDRIEGNSCPKWHLDRVRARLLCTWRGPGTEYGAARPDEPPLQTHRLGTGCVAIFRGFLWPGRESPGRRSSLAAGRRHGDTPLSPRDRPGRGGGRMLSGVGVFSLAAVGTGTSQRRSHRCSAERDLPRPIDVQ